jgi:hypothetical protein
MEVTKHTAALQKGHGSVLSWKCRTDNISIILIIISLTQFAFHVRSTVKHLQFDIGTNVLEIRVAGVQLTVLGYRVIIINFICFLRH